MRWTSSTWLIYILLSIKVGISDIELSFVVVAVVRYSNIINFLAYDVTTSKVNICTNVVFRLKCNGKGGLSSIKKRSFFSYIFILFRFFCKSYRSDDLLFVLNFSIFFFFFLDEKEKSISVFWNFSLFFFRFLPSMRIYAECLIHFTSYLPYRRYNRENLSEPLDLMCYFRNGKFVYKVVRNICQHFLFIIQFINCIARCI